MIATDFTTRDCLLGQARISYDNLQRDYVCALCGGGIIARTIVHLEKPSTVEPQCSKCFSHDFIHHSTYEKQLIDAWEIRRGLPDHLQELLPQKPKTEKLTFEQAVKDLYGSE